MPIDGSIISNLENQCKALPDWKEKTVIIRKISDELYIHMKTILDKKGCKITWDKENNRVIIHKNPEESDEDLLAGLEDLDTNVDWLDEELKKKEAEMKKKEAEMKKIERLALMNPTREVETVYLKFEKLFEKKDYDKLIDMLWHAYKANDLDSSYVDKEKWELRFGKDKKWWIWEVYIQKVEKRLKTSHWVEKEKLEKIRSLMEKIRKIVKFKAYGLA